jgi:hypothetical protein
VPALVRRVRLLFGVSDLGEVRHMVTSDTATGPGFQINSGF